MRRACKDTRVVARSMTLCVPIVEPLAWLVLLFLAALGKKLLRFRSLGCLHLAGENGELILSDLVVAQQRFERAHQPHLNPDKSGENVHLHFSEPTHSITMRQNLTRPLEKGLAVSFCLL